MWAHENYVISTVLHRWFSAQCHHSQSIRRCLAKLTGRSFISHQVDSGQSITVEVSLCNASVSWKSYIFTFGFSSIFTLTDIILQHAEGVIWPLSLWKPFKANCRFLYFFFFTNLLASPGKWESVFSFSSTAKTIHLDKSFSVMLSFKFLFLQKTGRQKLPEGWGHFFTKANSLVWAIFRWYYLDTSGVMSSLFDKVFTCLRTFLDLRQEPVKLSHIFTFIQGRWSLR